MLRRHRLTVAGLVLGAVVALGWFAIGESPAADVGSAPEPRLIHGAVEADGGAVGAPDGWRVTRSDDGRYQLVFVGDVTVTIKSWDVAAAVIARPVAAGTWSVAFDAGTQPVDAAFSFTATPVGD